MENTLHKKRCTICRSLEYTNKLVSLPVSPTKMICYSCIDMLYFFIVKERVAEELRKAGK